MIGVSFRWVIVHVFVVFFSLLAKLKEKWYKNWLEILESGLNSGWREEKAGKIP